MSPLLLTLQDSQLGNIKNLTQFGPKIIIKPLKVLSSIGICKTQLLSLQADRFKLFLGFEAMLSFVYELDKRLGLLRKSLLSALFPSPNL